MRMASFIGLAALAPVAAGQISYVSQTRQVSASAGPYDVETATDFGVFNAEASSSQSSPWGFASGYSQQRSELGAWSMTASSRIFSSGHSRASGSARSIFDVTFTLATATEVRLNGVLSAIPDYWDPGATSITFERVGGPRLARLDGVGIDPGDPNEVSFGDFRQVLEAGQYRIVASINCGGDTQRSSSYNFTLSVPAPGTIAFVVTGGLLAARRRR